MSNDRSLRSVFVGNIPYDATEEKLKEAFSEVGPVVSFRLVFDKDSGKPKGYGFCEYRDQETAQSAIRNLNNIELGGRALRVDSAANEKGRDEPRNQANQANPGAGVVTGANAGPLGQGLMPGVAVPPGMGMGQAMASTVGSGMITPAMMDQQPVYGQECDPEKSPEVISQAVASLPPEQMFELAKQMKQCIQSNPQEARNMLLANPQLAYALLQALVIMRVVEPQVAMSLLYRQNVPTSLSLAVPAAPPPMVPPVSDPVVWGPPGRPVAPNPVAAGVVPPSDPRLNPVPANVPPGPSIQPVARADPRLAARDPRLAGAAPTDPRLVASVPQPALAATDSTSREQLIVQVMNLTEEQIAKLPLEQRDTIRALKQQLLHPKI